MVNPKTTFSEKESSYLVLGLDIGIGSCGWCILDRAFQFYRSEYTPEIEAARPLARRISGNAAEIEESTAPIAVPLSANSLTPV